MISPSEKRQRVFDALHRTRLAPYLKAANNREQDALRIYIWHLRLTSSIQELLGVVEVVLRNAIDRELCAWNIQEGKGASWLLAQPASPLAKLTNGKRPEAVRNAEKTLENRDASHPRHQAAITHDDVLSAVMFGMWKDLMPNHGVGSSENNRENRNRKRMWDEAIINAFPHANDPNGEETYWRILRLHQLRNRASHMDSLLGIDILDRVLDVNNLMKSIDPHVAEWVTSINRVSAVWRERPKFMTNQVLQTATVPVP